MMEALIDKRAACCLPGWLRAPNQFGCHAEPWHAQSSDVDSANRAAEGPKTLSAIEPCATQARGALGGRRSQPIHLKCQRIRMFVFFLFTRAHVHSLSPHDIRRVPSVSLSNVIGDCVT